MQRVALLFLCTYLTNQSIHAQLPKFISYFSYDEKGIDKKSVKQWTPVNTTDYTGIYHFGESESEWDLIVLKMDSTFIFQTHSHLWGKSDKYKEETWIREYHTFNAVSLHQNKISAGSLKGFFASYKDGENYKGLIITADPVNDEASADTGLIGGKSSEKLKEYFYGDYPELSYRIADDKCLQAKTKEELQFMRNEIFARYGMRFNKSGKVYAHFIKKDWYNPCRNSVAEYLTDIEKKNIEKITALEKE